MGDELAHRRTAGGEWTDYFIDDNNALHADEGLPVLDVQPHAYTENEQLPAGSWLVQARIRLTFRGGKRGGIRTYERTEAATVVVGDGDARYLREAVEGIVDEYIEGNFFTDSPPEVDVLDVDYQATGGADLLHMPMTGPSTNIRNFLVRVAPAGGAGAGAAGAAPPAEMVYASNMDIEHHVSGSQCVVDYMLWEAAKMDSRKGHWTRKALNDALGPSPTTAKIIEFAKRERDVSVYAVDCTMKLFAKHTAEAQPRVWLVFMVKEYHCLPITNAKWRRYITREGAVPLDKITFDRWTFEEAQYLSPDDTDQLLGFVNAPVAGDEKVRVLPLQDLDAVAADVMAATGKVVERMKWVRSHIAAFEHPGNGVIIVAGADFPERRAFCDAMMETYRLDDFAFTNQSWGVIAASYMAAKYVALPPSTYGTEYLDILDRYPIGPYRAVTVTDRVPRDGDTSLDIRRCYSAILRNSRDEWAVFGPLDHVTEMAGGAPSLDSLTPGEYYVGVPIVMAGGSIRLSRGWYPHGIVRYAVSRGYVPLTAVTFALRASQRMAADVFTDFCTDVDATYPQQSKDMLNQLIGCFGRQYSTVTRSGTTTDLDTAVGTLAAIQLRGNAGSLFVHGGIAILQETERTRKTQGHVPLYRAILAGSWALLDEMYRAVATPSTTVLGFNTDSMKVRGTIDMSRVKEKDACAWGEWHAEEHVSLCGRPLDELPEREAYACIRAPVVKLSEAGGDAFKERLAGGSGLIMGPPGCGKTYLLAELWAGVEDKDAAVATAYTHAACQNLRDKGLPAVVFSSLVYNPQTQRMDYTKLAGKKRVLLDEYTMLPPAEMRVLLQAKAEYGFELWAAGDHRQCTAPVDNPVEYHTNPLFLGACGNLVVELQYKVGTGRYDAGLHAAIEQFQTTSTLAAWRDAPPPPPVCFTNICYTNAKRRALNATCLAAWLASNPHGAVVDAGTPARPFPVCANLPVMAYHGHIHEHDILKTQVWRVVAISAAADTVQLAMAGREDVSLSFKAFRDVFDYSFAMTVQKCQGLTVPEFVVHELDHPRATANTVYTAISRGVTQSKVHLADVTDWGRVYAPQAMGGSTLLTASTLAPFVHRLVVYRITPFFGSPADFLGVASGRDVEDWDPDRLVAALVPEDGVRPAGMPAPDTHEAVVGVITTLFVRDLRKTPAILDEFVNRELAVRGAVWNRPASVPSDGDGGAGAAGTDCDATETASAMDVSEAGSISTGGRSSASSGSRKRRFEPKHYPAAACFTVRCQAAAIPPEHRVRRFSYTPGNATSEESARERAEEWSRIMRDTYL